MRLPFIALSTSGLLAWCVPGLAHHSQAMFDTSRTVTLSGTVAEFNWVNPHSSFKIEVTDKDGKTAVWAVEMNSPQNLVRSGWKRTSLKKGDRITAVVRPLRDGKPGGLYVSVTLADGTTIDESAPPETGNSR